MRTATAQKKQNKVIERPVSKDAAHGSFFGGGGGLPKGAELWLTGWGVREINAGNGFLKDENGDTKKFIVLVFSLSKPTKQPNAEYVENPPNGTYLYLTTINRPIVIKASDGKLAVKEHEGRFHDIMVAHHSEWNGRPNDEVMPKLFKLLLEAQKTTPWKLEAVPVIRKGEHGDYPSTFYNLV